MPPLPAVPQYVNKVYKSGCRVAGTFIYNGVRCFHEMQTIDHAEEVFEFLYNVSVGLERLLKVAIILLEHDKIEDQEKFEK